MGNILINKNYGNNFTVQAGATVVAGGPGAAMMREKIFASQEEEAGTQDLVTTDDGSTQGTDVDGSNHFGFEVWALKTTEERMKFSIETMKGEKCPLCKNNYFGYGQAWQYAYVFELLRNGDEDLPRFNKVKEFLDYLGYLGIEGLPTDETINSRLKLIKGKFPSIIRKTKCYRFTKRNVPKRKTKRIRYRCPPEPYSNSVKTDFFSYSNAIILENQQINTSI